MGFRKTIYAAVVAVLGITALWAGAGAWTIHAPLEYAFYLGLAVVASHLKVILPGVTGTMSVSFVFILIGVTELSTPETLTIGWAGMLAQLFWHARTRPKPFQVVFNLVSITTSVACCGLVYHAPWIQLLDASLPIRLFFAAIAFFLANTASVAGIIALTESKSAIRVWYGSFFWTAPQYLVGATLAGGVHYLNRWAGWQVTVLVAPVLYLVHHSYRLYLGRLEEEKNHVEDVANLHLRTIKALAMAIDAKDNNTHDHLRRVQVYAHGVAKEIGLGETDMRALEAAALLHDIGKLEVPEYIISKPGRLTPEEFDKMKIHPQVGAEILECVEFPYPVVPIVRAHHERWDGTGYPLGLKGEQIPICARILAAVDCLDALASDRQYRRALPLDEAMAQVAAGAGTAFDPRVIEILQRRYLELERAAQATPSERARLSTNARVHLGQAPAAGFEKQAPPHTGELAQHFVNSIAAARQEFQMLLEVTSDLGTSLSLEETLSLLAVRLKPMVPHDAIAIYVRNGETLVPQYVTGENFRLFASLEIPMGQGLSGWVAENKKPIVNGNPSVEPGYLHDPAKFSTLRSAIAVPLEGVGGVVGVLTLYHAEYDAFNQDHLRILLAISSKAGLTIENALRYRQVERSAVTDQLTGLPNARSLFLQLDLELARCKRTGKPLAVMVLDLDGFKQVNDRFGHLVGNKVLQQTAAGFKNCCREYDYVARMGGDEFVVILPGVTGGAVNTKAQQLAEVAMEVGRRVCGEQILSLSAGTALFPSDGTDAEQLLAEADMHMYQMKRMHRSGVKLPPVLESFAPAAEVIQ